MTCPHCQAFLVRDSVTMRCYGCGYVVPVANPQPVDAPEHGQAVVLDLSGYGGTE